MSASYNGILLADLHFGAIPQEQMKEEIKFILEYITNRKKIHYVVFLGDLFDHKMWTNDPSIGILQQFISSVMTLAKCMDFKVRMVYGTESHECDQYHNLFSTYELDKNIDFKIIQTVTEEELFPDLRVLYIPEEYITEKKSTYYEDFFSKENEYDYIFGHGVITEAMTMIRRESADSFVRSKSPKFTTADFDNCCKGKIYFGHYHVHTNIDDKSYYVGSYCRWIHGEEKPKGFLDIKKSGKSYTENFIENADATVYKTYSFGYDHDIFSSEESMINHTKTLRNMITIQPEGSHIKFVFNIPINYKNPEFFMNYMKSYFKSDSLVSLDFVNGYVTQKHNIDQQELKDTLEKFDYILQKEDSLASTISRFIQEKNGFMISPDSVSEYLYSDVQKLLNKKMDGIDNSLLDT